MSKAYFRENKTKRKKNGWLGESSCTITSHFGPVVGFKISHSLTKTISSGNWAYLKQKSS